MNLAIFALLNIFWEKCSHSNHYSSITKRDFELPISVKLVLTLLIILPTKMVLWVSPKYKKYRFLFSLFTVLTPLWHPLYVSKEVFADRAD